MNRLRKQLFLAVSLAALMLMGPIPFLLAQTTVITAGGGGGGTPSFPLLAPDGTAAAPSYSFASATNLGIYKAAASAEIVFSSGGADQLSISSGDGGLTTRNDRQYKWSSTATITSGQDTGVERVAPGVVGSTDGSTGEGWFQNEAGDQFLTADHTNATATPTNLTDLTTTVTSGRKYSCVLTLMQSQSVAADGVRVDFEGGTATATNFRAHVTILDGVTMDTHTSVTALATDVTSTDVGTTVLTKAEIAFEPSGTGTFIPRVGLEAASTGTITTFRGSTLMCKDTP